MNSKKYHPLSEDIVAAYQKIRSRPGTTLCKAPFNSIFFAPGGKILACWYNKREELGTWPKNSVAEIWNGKKIHELREHIKNNDFSYGCEFCLTNLLDQNYHKVDAYRYDYLSDHASKYPSSFDFQISNTCNFECIMCNGELSSGVRRNRERQELYFNPYNDDFVKQLEEFMPHLQDAAFSGGEPFLIPIYYKIWDSMIRINPSIKISLTTNGSILNEKVEEYLGKLHFNIAVSIDSLQSGTYHLIRRGGDLSQMLEHFKYFRDYAKRIGTSLSIKTCPMRQNILEMPEIVAFADANKVPVFFNTVVYPPLCSIWNDASEHILSYHQQLEKAVHAISPNGFPGNKDRLLGLIQQLKLWYREAMDREKLLSSVRDLSTQYPDLIRKKIADFMGATYYYTEAEKAEKTDHYTQFISDTLQAMPDDKGRQRAMLYFLGLSTARLLAEMEFRTPQKMADRFTYLADDTNE